MGCVTSAEDDGAMAELEIAAARADELAEEKEEDISVVDARRQSIRQVFIDILSRPRIKKPFDPSNPTAHLEPEKEDDEEDPTVAKAAPPEPKMPPGMEPDPVEEEPASMEDSDDDVSISDVESEEEEESDEEGEKPEFIAPVARDTQLEDIIELKGGKEVWEDIDEMRLDETAGTILGRAGEHDSCYPWAKAHFMAVCYESEKLTAEGGDEWPEGADPNAAAGGVTTEPEAEADDDEDTVPGANAPIDNYICAVLRLRMALSHIQRANIRLRVNLAKDIAATYFNPDGQGTTKIGYDLFELDQEAIEAKFKAVTKAGIQLMIDRVEERIDKEILPEYYAAYEENGDKEAMAYPEEVYIMETYYPPGEDQSDDEDAQSQLDVTVHKAQGVLAMDSSLGGEGTSDCFVKATVGDETFVTDVRKGTCNPMWDKTFKFDVDPEERAGMNLVLRMYDEDFGGDDFMGRVDVPLRDLVRDGPPVSEWYDLKDEPKSRAKPIDRGRIYLTLRFGEPTIGEAMTSEDNVSPVAIAQVPAYKNTRIQIHYAATMIQALFRGWNSRIGVRDKKAGKNAEAMAIEKRVIMIQRKWRDKRMWKIIMNFKRQMTAGGEFLKYSTNGKSAPRQIHCPGNMQKIFWREFNAKEDGNFIEVKDVKAILVGRCTRNFRKHDKKYESDNPGKTIPEERHRASFSIVTPDRTLDLECSMKGGEEKRNEWLDLFAFLLRDELHSSSFLLLAKRKIQFKNK